MPEFLDTPEIQVTDEDINQNRVYGILSYIGILWLVGMIAGGDSRYTRFHVNQGIVLTVFWAAFNLVMALLDATLGQTFLAFLLYPLHGIGNLPLLAFMAFGIVFAAKGRAKELPFIGRFHWYDKNN